MTTIADLWQRLETWGEANAPDMLADLNAGASREALAELENGLCVTLPATFKDSLATHDGEDDGWPCKAFADLGAYLSCAEIAKEWSARNDIARGEEDNDLLPPDIAGPVKPDMFNDRWIPFLNCNGDRIWALDLDPADGGTPGQIIEIDWECGYQAVIADSFETMFREYVSALEAGDYELVEGRPTREREHIEIEQPSPDTEALAERRQRRDDALADLVGSGFLFLVALAGWTVVRMVWVQADLRRTLILVASIFSLFILVEAPLLMRRPLKGRAKAQRALLLPLGLGSYLLASEGFARLRFLADGFSLLTISAALVYIAGGFAVLRSVYRVYRIERPGD